MTSDEKQSEESQLNALQHNNVTKGNIAYYYAHGSPKNGPAWDGDPSPRLLERSSSSPKQKRLYPIARYSWIDENSKIRIYVPFEPSSIDLQKDDIKLEWTTTSLKMIWNLPDSVHTLRIPKLYDSIENAVFRLKSDKVVITLKKPTGMDHKW
eukprot:CAMPEP_0197301450 /NCGR_PEP_ID=MMETSP0890-20130614/50406_1 /TAXON_ID=44058 ORGANISM="Aureoumbra lagunensis, Strain CCMP1510" /NCGR_SAMPLE_ID=MMETSP0890 /ASSEMBLY_ACC=CAM_ASM_000533 /LENGTH=152 /DNA_ID=CAMNT_0042780749 /DNA_START=1127 /DNA_END=1582 /DNA_ORIENTATION=+